jgi:hypothetical protein
LKNMALVRLSRISVVSVAEDEWERMLALGSR